jgi:catechol-2,3-dioxygenase
MKACPSRREVLAWSAGMFLALHNDGISAIQGAEMLPTSLNNHRRILSLELLTAAPLGKMKEFYCHLLGLRAVAEKPDRLTVVAGDTEITFVPAKPDEGRPFYHFAFNIPENKILAARDWQKERTPLLPIPPRLRDPKYPDDVVDYNHWNAHSIFFFDPAENVVEYIARHDLKNDRPGPFDSKDILYASEIAFVVDDVAAAAAKLKEVVGIEQYRGGSDQFMALGDELGLLLVMKRGRIISFDAKETKAVSVFRTTASFRGVKSAKYSLPDFPYQIHVEV